MNTFTSTVLTALVLAGAIIASKARADELHLHSTIAVRNIQIVNTAHKSYLYATAINISPITLEYPELTLRKDGYTARHTGPSKLNPGEAYRINAPIADSIGLNPMR